MYIKENIISKYHPVIGAKKVVRTKFGCMSSQFQRAPLLFTPNTLAQKKYKRFGNIPFMLESVGQCTPCSFLLYIISLHEHY